MAIIAILATQKKEVPVTSRTFHLRLACSHTYLRKIIRKLVVSELVSSFPGNGGGFVLARAPEKITVLEVVEAIEGETLTYRPTGLLERVLQDASQKEYVESGNEKLQELFHQADQKWRFILQKVSVAELVKAVLGPDHFAYRDWNQGAEEIWLENQETE